MHLLQGQFVAEAQMLTFFHSSVCFRKYLRCSCAAANFERWSILCCGCCFVHCASLLEHCHCLHGWALGQNLTDTGVSNLRAIKGLPCWGTDPGGQTCCAHWVKYRPSTDYWWVQLPRPPAHHCCFVADFSHFSIRSEFSVGQLNRPAYFMRFCWVFPWNALPWADFSRPSYLWFLWLPRLCLELSDFSDSSNSTLLDRALSSSMGP